MHLVMFDIDGTLTASNQVDTESFLEALEEILGIEGVDPDWAQYKNATDQGLLEEIVRCYRNRILTRPEGEAVKARHLELLYGKIARDPGVCQPVHGARKALFDLGSQANVAVSLATGSWFEAARIKLESAQILYEDLPMGSSDDSITRKGIMRKAEERTRLKTGCPSFQTKTYVGDAPWDIQAARQLKYEFIGIARGPLAEKLKEAGADYVVPNYREDTFMKCLEKIWRSK
jgi:phosphoglycolate phosphatase-like HAD superfamily hydrolase